MSKKPRFDELEPAAPGLSPSWTSREAYLLALVCLFAGLALGYLFRDSSSSMPAVSASPVPVTSPAGGTSAPLTAQALDSLAQPLLMAIKANPKNVDALIQLGNLYYDHQVYPECIDYYKRALELRPHDPNVRTDLGTAYWYSGFADMAISEYQRVLAAEPTFAPALMNLGIVRLDGLKDPAGAVAAWEKMLSVSPQHPDRARVLSMIERARAMKK